MTPVEQELVFGRLVGAHQIDDAVTELLQTWIETYLWEVARQSQEEFERLAKPRSWRISTDMEKMPEDQVPGVIITSDGLSERPDKMARAKATTPGRSGFPYSATWEYQVGLLASAKGKKEVASPRALRRARMYGLAARAAMIQQRDANDLLGMIDWVNEEYNGLESTADRTICLCVETFHIDVHDVTSWSTGPLFPDPGPPDPQMPLWPLVEETDADVIKVPQLEDVQNYP